MSSSGRKTQINQKCFKLFLYIFSAGKKERKRKVDVEEKLFIRFFFFPRVARSSSTDKSNVFFFFSCVSWSRFRQCGNYPGPRYADEEPYLPLSQVPSVRRPIDIGLDLIASAGNKQFTGIFLLPRSGGQLCVQLRVKGTYLVLSKLSLSKLLKLAYNEKNKLKFHDFSLIFI